MQITFEVCRRESNSTPIVSITHLCQFLKHLYSDGRLLINTTFRWASKSQHKVIIVFIFNFYLHIGTIQTTLLVLYDILFFHGFCYCGTTAIENCYNINSLEISEHAQLLLKWVYYLGFLNTFVTHCIRCILHDAVSAIINPDEGLCIIIKHLICLNDFELTTDRCKVSVFKHYDLRILCFHYSLKTLLNDFKVLLCLIDILETFKSSE